MEKPVNEITEENEEVKVQTNETEEKLESEVPTEDAEELEDEEVDAEEESDFVEAKERIKKKEKKIEDEDIVEERFYTIPLGKVWISPRKKRAPKAARVVRKFVIKHMKVQTEATEDEEAERLIIANEVNEKLWSRGIEKPPRRIRVRVVKDKEGVVTVLLAEGE